jgi:hypothetical protein
MLQVSTAKNNESSLNNRLQRTGYRPPLNRSARLEKGKRHTACQTLEPTVSLDFSSMI